MKKENFISLVLGAIGVILFGLGMCMCLLPEWDAFRQGEAVGAAGLVVLAVMLAARRKMQGKPPVHLSLKAVGTVLLAILGALALGIGMCMTMVWEGLLLPGVAVGLVGILLLLGLIPLCRGLR
nr:hypothetical protein [uncultured Dysosmobacter sp.]